MANIQETLPNKNWKTASKAALLIAAINVFFTFIIPLYPLGNVILLAGSYFIRNYLNKRGWQSAWTVVLVTNLLILQVGDLFIFGLQPNDTGLSLAISIFLLSYSVLIAFYYLYEPVKGDYQHILNIILVLLVFFFLTREYKIYFPYTILP